MKKVTLLAAPTRLDRDTEDKAVLGAQQESRTGKHHLSYGASNPAITRAPVNQIWVLIPNLYVLASFSSTMLFSQFENLFYISRV